MKDEVKKVELSIYQVNMERDEKRLAFFGMDEMIKISGTDKINSKIYDKVYSCDKDFSDLEDVYQTFNLNHPADYMARSLSVSDVVEVKNSEKIEGGFYFCNDIGFKKIDFEPKEAQLAIPKKERMRVVLIEPGRYAKEAYIGKELEDMQAVVGGSIEQFCPYEDEVALICDEEGKLCGKNLNRAIYDDDGQMIEIMAGTFFICAAPSDSSSFQSLSDEQVKKYVEQFRFPEQFFRLNDEIKAMKYNPEKNYDKER